MNLKNELKKKQTWFVVLGSLVFMAVSAYLGTVRYQISGLRPGSILSALFILFSVLIVARKAAVWQSSGMSGKAIGIFVGLIGGIGAILWNLIYWLTAESQLSLIVMVGVFMFYLALWYGLCGVCYLRFRTYDK